MTNFIKKTGMLFVFFILSVNSFAQSNDQIETTEGFTQSGKIYVVVAVASVIFIGIIVYLISIDRKVSKLEKEINIQ